MYSKLKVNGYDVYLTGRTEDRLLVSSAVQMILDYEQSRYLKLFENDVDVKKTDVHMNLEIMKNIIA